MNKNGIQKACSLGIIIILSGLLLIGGVSASEFGPWSLETVASSGSVGQYSSIALDAAGNPAISFYDQTYADLKYASWDGSQWVISTVDCSRAQSKNRWFFWDWGHDRTRDSEYIQCFHGTEKVGKYSSLVFDRSGKPKISYYDESKGDLKYASWDGTSWVISTVDASRNVGEYSSLALDESDNPRISYYDQKNKNLKYAAWNGIRWIITTVDRTKNVGEYSSLALDESGNPRISYYDQKNKDLKYASWDGSRWEISTVDGTVNGKGQNRYTWDGDRGRIDTSSKKVGKYSSLALDNSGNPCISYYDETNKNLKYALWDGSRWVVTTVDSTKRVGEYSSLDLDANNDPRISYYDATNSDLKFAAWDRTNLRWVTETVDSSRKVGSYTSLALDAQGNPHISYYDQTNKNLKYAAGTGHTQNPGPTVTGITPSSGIADTLVSVTDLAGTNFVEGTIPEVRLEKAGETDIIATNVTVVSSSRITCDIHLPPSTPSSVGQWDIVVKNSDGQSGMLTQGFTVIEQPTTTSPTVTAITPANGDAGMVVPVTNLAGTNFVVGTTPIVLLVKAGETNITATGVTVVSTTQITCTFTLPSRSETNLGQWDVVVQNEDGQSGTLPLGFTITDPLEGLPVLTSIIPDSGIAGSTVTITELAGMNFVPGTTPEVWLTRSGEDNIMASDVIVVSPTKITCTFTLPASTTLGAWGIGIRNVDGKTGNMAPAFTVIEPPAAPVITGITPSSGTAGSTVIITDLAGMNFVPGTTPEVWLVKSGESNITATDVAVISATRITCTLQLPPVSPTSIGGWDIVVKNADGQSGILAQGFTVTDIPAPIITGITPSSGTAGSTVIITDLAGMNFVPGTTPQIWLAKAGESNVTATNVIVVSPTQITCTVELPAPSATSLGQWDLFVTNADGKSGSRSAAFTVEYDQSPSISADWALNGWEGWEHSATWTGTETGPCSEYGPVMVDGHGEHGSVVSLQRGTTESSVWKTFTAPYGTGYDTLTFSGLMSSSSFPGGRTMVIDINGEQVFGATALNTPPGNGEQFVITASFPRSETVVVKITHGQKLATNGSYIMQFNSLGLSQEGSG